MTRSLLRFSIILLSVIIIACSNDKLEKGFSVNTVNEEDTEVIDGVNKSLDKLKVRPGDVLTTYHNEHRLTPVFLVNKRKDEKGTFIGTPHFYSDYSNLSKSKTWGNNWHYNYLPGLEAMSGYNLVNVSHYNTITQKANNFFTEPVLVKTLYYPSYTKDTLNFSPVQRDYYLVSAYTQDTNNDGYINEHDLRRFYYFPLEATKPTLLIPEQYAVVSSTYDSANDYLLVYAQLDEDKNSKRDAEEEQHVFWVDLKNPLNNGRMY